MKIGYLMDKMKENQIEFFTGIPDSRLRALCDYLIERYGTSDHHIIAENEGGCMALAAGYHLATNKVPCIYMQNSGLGNALNPIVSLMHRSVYAIPGLLVIGWRGEPDGKDEPQHMFQGEITPHLLRLLRIPTFVLTKSTTKKQLDAVFQQMKKEFERGGMYALVVGTDALESDYVAEYSNDEAICRESCMERMVSAMDEEDFMISTTGKCSRELFEIRENNKQGHGKDFLTVGSMGHCSMIALGVALEKKNKRIWCLDGDGSVIMHMGAMALIGSRKPDNLIHVVFNNGAHESVGGMPTVADKTNLLEVAKACGYRMTYGCRTYEEVDGVMERLKGRRELTFIEIKTAIGSRNDLGRPTATPIGNKEAFMKELEK